MIDRAIEAISNLGVGGVALCVVAGLVLAVLFVVSKYR